MKSTLKEDKVLYQKLRKQFLSSYGYYLRQSTSTAELERLFLAGVDVDVHFSYTNLSLKNLEKRRETLKNAERQVDASMVRSRVFLHQRLLETELLLSQAHAWQNGQLPESFHRLNTELFGELNQEVFSRLLGNAQRGVRSHFKGGETDYLAQNTATLKDMIQPLSQKALKLIEKNSLAKTATILLKQTGMYGRGWRIVEDTTRPSSLVAPRTKKLVLGTSIVRRTDPIKQIALLMHELTHVTRAKYRSPEPENETEQKELSAFEEGLAHAVERISSGRVLIPARYWRYLAIGLSHGIDSGKPRTAREVYDTLLPLYEKFARGNDPQHFIFGTVLRVWKGMPFSIAGGAISKDLRYVQGSLMVIETLSRQKLSKREFRFLLTHKVK